MFERDIPSHETTLQRIVQTKIKYGVFVNNQKKYAGSFGDVSLLSFGMMKNYNSLYGGACLTSIDDLAEYIESKQNSLKKRREDYEKMRKIMKHQKTNLTLN